MSAADEGPFENVYPLGNRNPPRPEDPARPGEDDEPVSRPPARSSRSSGQPGAPARHRRRWPLRSVVVGAVLLVAAAVLLVLWRPWERETDRVTRQLAVGGYSADVPHDWEPWRRPGIEAQTVLAPMDWSGIFLGEPGTAREAAAAARRDPDSVVGLYVAEKPLLDARDPAEQREQIQASLPSSTISPPGDETEMVGRSTSTFEGSLHLTPDEVLHLHLYLMEGPSPVLLVFFAPAAVDQAWSPTFLEIAASVRAPDPPTAPR